MFIDIFVWRLDLLTFSTLNFYKLCSQMCEVKKIDAARGIFCLEAQSHSGTFEANSFQISKSYPKLELHYFSNLIE